MEVVHIRCAGMDVSKRDAKVCIRVAGRGRRKTVETVRTWASTTNAILRLREHLIAEQVTLGGAGGHRGLLEAVLLPAGGAGFQVMLVNARQVKNLPGRKSDVSDATWLAQLGAHGLVRGSFVPPAPIRELRDLTRARTMMTRERGREIQRLEKLLEDAGIKLSSRRHRHHRGVRPVDAPGPDRGATRPGRARRAGQAAAPDQDPGVDRGVDRAVQRAPRRSWPGCISRRSTNAPRPIDELTARIEVVMEPFRSFCELIAPSPGSGHGAAEVIVAETGADMSIFPTAAHLASWAGTCPGSNESAGRVKSTATRPGNAYLKAALGAAALSIAHTHGTYLVGEIPPHRRATRPEEGARRCRTRHLERDLDHGPHRRLYDDPGADYYTRHEPERSSDTPSANSNDSATTSPSPPPPQQPRDSRCP